MSQNNIDETISFLKRYVKVSAVPGQKHISPDLVNAEDLSRYQQAMIDIQKAIDEGTLTETEFKSRVGLD